MGMRARKQSDYETDGAKLRGKDASTMTQMFDKSGSKAESFQSQLLNSLNENKKKYDQQLYSDWLSAAYVKCAQSCLRQTEGKQLSELRNVEKLCGRNCIRKMDKVYRLYDKLEIHILEQYCEDEQVDVHKFINRAQAQMAEKQMSGDMEHAQKMMGGS